MKEKLLKWTGLEQKSEYVRDRFFAVNMRSSVYMSVIMIALEAWMIIRLLSRQLMGIDIRSDEYYISHYSSYALLLTAAALMLIYAVRFILGKKVNKTLGYLLKWALMLICLYFGIEISVADYSRGEQVFTFLTMELFAACLFTWYPYIGFVIISASYGIFYFILDNTPVAATGLTGATDATKINMFIMWLATLFCSFSSYNRTMQQVVKDEHLERINGHLNDISIHDELTGIHNMVYFRTEAMKLLNYVTTDRENIIYLFFDIENFKSYNETYGFHKGSELLVNTAKLLEKSFPGSLVSRFSDDHFVVLTKRDGYEAVVDEIAAEIQNAQGDVRIQLKCGAYIPKEGESDPMLACDKARFACASIKRHFGSSCRLYDTHLEEDFRLKRHIVNNIDKALAEERIKVYYQPIISTGSGKVCGLEALSRWKDPKYGMISPASFIGVLEEHRQIHKLDKYIVEKVCRDLKEAVGTGGGRLPVSVNFSRLDFELCDIVGHLCDMTDKYDIDRSLIDVEITESALSDQQAFLPAAVKALRRKGFRVWLDDFGSGYSSLNVLKDYQFDVLKIDMKFLSGFSDNEKTKPILTNIVSLSKELGMISLTEGVETHEQYEFLRSIGCDNVQGFLFSKPVPKDELDRKITDGKLNT